MHDRDLRATAYIPVAAVLSTCALLLLLTAVGPRWTINDSQPQLNPAAWHWEPTDRLILIGWWVISVVLIAVFARHPRARKSVTPTVGPRRLRVAVPVVAGVMALTVVVMSLTWGADVTGTWPGISGGALIVGSGFALITLVIWLASPRVAVAGTLIVVAVVLAFALPALLQSPASIASNNWYDFQFTSDEVSAVAAGRFPLSDYVPQYSVLIGFPVAAILGIAKGHADVIVIAYLIALQGVALAAAISIPVFLGRWRMLAPAMVVVVMPTLVVMLNGQSPATYFAGTPMRILLPTILIVATFRVLARQRDLDRRQVLSITGLGAISGLTMLNNLDFGGPAALATMLVVVFALLSLRARAVALGVFTVGLLLVFVGYATLGLTSGHPVDWGKWIAFHRLFGAEGFNAISMRPFGLHVAFVALFMCTLVTGAVLVLRSRSGRPDAPYRQGLAMALVGGWGVLALPYFASRSLTPTLVGGYAFIAGLSVAVSLPLIRAGARGSLGTPWKGPWVDRQFAAAVTLAFGLIAVAGASSALALVPTPSESFAKLKYLSPFGLPVLDDQVAAIKALASGRGSPEVRAALDAGTVEQALNMASLTSLATGVPSGTVVSNPAYFGLSAEFRNVLCTADRQPGISYLLVDEPTSSFLSEEATCTERFDFTKALPARIGDFDWVLLPYVGSGSGQRG